MGLPALLVGARGRPRWRAGGAAARRPARRPTASRAPGACWPCRRPARGAGARPAPWRRPPAPRMSIRHSGRTRSRRSSNSRATSPRSAARGTGAPSRGDHVLGQVEAGSGTHSGASSGPPSRRVRAGAASSRAADRLAQLGQPGAARAHHDHLARVAHHGRALQRQDRAVGVLQRDRRRRSRPPLLGQEVRAVGVLGVHGDAVAAQRAVRGRPRGHEHLGQPHEVRAAHVARRRVPARAQAGHRDHLAAGAAHRSAVSRTDRPVFTTSSTTSTRLPRTASS